MRTLKLYWWQKGPRFGNFGDELSRWLVERLSGRRVIYAALRDAELVAIGSLLEPHHASRSAWADYRGYVWGAGRMYDGSQLDLKSARVVAVRGPKTLQGIVIDEAQQPALGDPALLVPEFFDRPPADTVLGILPHWSERQHPFYRSINLRQGHVKLIDPVAPVEQVVRELVGCQSVLSSSMHGLIIADAFSIPNAWLRLETGKESALGYSEFKYLDYFAAVGRDSPKVIRPSRLKQSFQLRAQFQTYTPPQVEQVQFPLFRDISVQD
jgi:pyruvyltransferase